MLVNMKAVKLELDLIDSGVQGKKNDKTLLAKRPKVVAQATRQESEENKVSNDVSNGQSSSSVLEQGQSPGHDTGVSSRSTICAAPIRRQFWKAGIYEDTHGPKVIVQSNKSYLHVHPLFLHSNATSHKWAFGAIAELLDNAVDEIQNGATYVTIDKISNPRDASPVLLIQDDGGGMDPEAIRRCMSFGFSDKNSKMAIGQYGNGFKTSTMRLGADVIVFTRRTANSVLTQSVGLLSYTFLRQMGHNRIVVPMVDYEFNKLTGNFGFSNWRGKEQVMSNLSMLLQWSPFSTEVELLKQFDDIGSQGTKVIIYNLWLSDDGNMELDFDTDPADIRISGDIKKVEALPAWRKMNEEHIANRLHYSLRAYLSILYLRIPDTFKIVLRGQVVVHHNLANDLKFVEYILYKPHTVGSLEAQVVTTIGFLKEAPHISVHGFNVYHKNRLILPYWRVVNYADSRGRGVVGVLEANFIEPTHNKQDFERTPLFQKLESRLKEMTWEYWDFHCGLIGYQVKKKPLASEPIDKIKPVILNKSSAVGSRVTSATGIHMKRKAVPDVMELENVKRQAQVGTLAIVSGHSLGTKPASIDASQSECQEAASLMQENKKLQARCLEKEKTLEELGLKVTELRSELGGVQLEYERLTAELASLEAIKEENDVNM
ncbi:hypothetical protein K2173_022859 [Erythroxylum novogranatense]|uniref:Morc S5 domain-containing protein n=1 Tax=Erythroxylum novogranatense TaxID=1862640 RepID=A0AAV8SNT6_9ROSI|nr:hypothetical protein K2173_022859 [Erythroxylum novogranatense]